jgi:glycerol uptake facilitator-like aquaporin
MENMKILVSVPASVTGMASRRDRSDMEPADPGFCRRLVAEAAGTMLLLATVVGSGIMAERLAAGNAAMVLLANALATGAGLMAFICALAPISGAHSNPLVTIAVAAKGEWAWRHVTGSNCWARLS